MAAADQVEVPVLCEIFDVSPTGTQELLVAGDSLQIKQDASGLILQVGVMSIVLLTGGVMETVKTSSSWAFLFPHESGHVFVIQVYPREGDDEHISSILNLFGQLSPAAAADTSKTAGRGRGSTAAKITSGGEWLSKKIVATGAAAAAFIDKKGKEYVEGKDTKHVEVSSKTQSGLDYARFGAGLLLQGATTGLSFAVAGFKTAGRAAAHINRKTGALDKLAAQIGTSAGGGQSETTSFVIEVGSAGVDAALDVYHSVKKAADVVTDQSERTAVQVAGDLYGEEVRAAAKSGVGAVADVGRAGAKILQVAGDEVEVAMECAIEFADQTLSLEDFLQEAPVLEGQVRRQDPMTFQWNDRCASLSAKGLLFFKDEVSMRAKDKHHPPTNMMSADDILAVETENSTRLVIRTRDHVIHRLEVRDGLASWFDAVSAVQRNSRRFRALSG
eukprot:TRINITY_DN110959_c0_g1_i1.p1 TRINITY_DN110959_c0_g1~~TRINITY_DN110959_c0_g1_i1.p1  ORF type:complete len:445 (-),score=85.99 TRINITY_DN110959_c0_g1_i1:73-1407(-)